MDKLTKTQRGKLMASIRTRNTTPEIAVRKIIHGMGYRYRLHARELPGRPDIVFRSKSKVIFVHGCFWHAHENCPKGRMPKSRESFWKLEGNRRRDERVRYQLKRMGWKSAVVWECELSDLDHIQHKISRFLDKK